MKLSNLPSVAWPAGGGDGLDRGRWAAGTTQLGVMESDPHCPSSSLALGPRPPITHLPPAARLGALPTGLLHEPIQANHRSSLTVH